MKRRCFVPTEQRPAASNTGSDRYRHAVMMAMAVTMLGLSMAAGCGNYSNEDLEFMSALPVREDLALEVPRRSGVTATSAEGWRTTVKVTSTLNAVADGFLALIDGIRAHYPTTREANTRIWGPFPAENNPGWRVEFRMSKIAAGTGARFDYELVMIPPAGLTLPMNRASTTIIAGYFDATGTARAGSGRLIVTLDEGRAVGLILTDLEKLRTLVIDYQTRIWPRTVTMEIENLPALPPADDATRATYVHTRAENGAGTMTFSMVRNVIDLMNAVDETLQIESRWLASGQGRQDVAIIAGDGLGAMATECWNDRFESTYTIQNWVTPPNPTGDPGTCIPRP